MILVAFKPLFFTDAGLGWSDKLSLCNTENKIAPLCDLCHSLVQFHILPSQLKFLSCPSGPS